MLGFLFRGLTAAPVEGAALFDALTGEARRPSWYVEGQVLDTLDGRFAVLATVVALALARIERDGEAGNRLSVALTERFIEVMESEHRELGLGDPTLGKTVRKLVGMLARKTELWRAALTGEVEWLEASRQSLYKAAVESEALRHSGDALRIVSGRLDATPLADLEQGRIA
ncbi:MAG TPA: ubiquinol-cytochrome C chaperone family protein [Sphingomicrobium sp.]|nr:ubiquinol-cytochrome C chaperone family protein [Sphingomicrobium sp.]